MYLAWRSIIGDKVTLNLDPFQVGQAEKRLKEEDGRISGQLPEVFQWLLVPVQRTPADPVTWEASRLAGAGELAVRASKTLKREELLVGRYASTWLRRDLDRIPLWQDHVEVRQLAEHYARYTYLQRIEDPSVIVEAVREGVGLLTWETDTFAYAEGYDEETGRYLALRAGQTLPPLTANDPGLVVRPDVAREQIVDPPPPPPPPNGNGPPPPPPPSPPDAGPRRFHGSVDIDPVRAGKIVAKIAEEVASHLTGLVGSKVDVTLEIEAKIPDGAPEHVVRTVTENARTLGFGSHGFEEE